MYEQHTTGVASSHGHRSTVSGKQMDRPYLVRRSHSTPCSESDNNLEGHGGSSSSSNAPVTRSQSNKRIIPPYSNRSLANSPPNTPNKLTGSTGKLNQNNKLIALKIILLDDSVTIIQAQSKALGRVVFDQVCKQLNVLESDYFGLEYNPPQSSQSNASTAPSSPPPLSSSSSILNSSSLISTSATTPTHLHSRSTSLYWLDLEKRLTRQVAFNLQDPVLRFSVKFYTPDPSQLEEEFTRYLFSLQIKRDLQHGTLACNDNTAALMASYIVQAECGDFSEEDYPDASYLSLYKFIPHQDYEIERKIRENHKKHIGQSPAEADLHLLETARRTELYGIRMHPARDEDGIALNLSVCHNGLLVFQNFTKINTFSWAKIRKLSFKRKRFILKLHPEQISDGYYKDLVEFIFDSRNDCKSYWKRCVEHHAFFRCEKAPNPIHRSKGLLSSRGSSFRYSGRTQKQMVQFVRENFVKRPAPPAQGAAAAQAVTSGGVLVPDVSSSDNNSFDNSIVSGGERGEGRGSGRFQRSSSLRSAASAHHQVPPQHPHNAGPQQPDYGTVLSKSLSTIAGSKNYEEDTIIYTTRAEVAAAQRAAASSSVAPPPAQQPGPRGNNYYIGEGVRSRRGSSGGVSASRSLSGGGDIDDGDEDEEEEEDEEDDGELEDDVGVEDYGEEEEVNLRGCIKRGGVRGSGGSRGSMGRAQSMDAYHGQEVEDEDPHYRPQSRSSAHHRSSSTDIYAISTKETQTPTHTGYSTAPKDPDWFFYLSKELSHVFTTYLKDLRLLKHLLANQELSYVLPQSVLSQTEVLATQINALMRDRELWEDGRHGLEVVGLCLRYFQGNEEAYGGYVGRLEEMLLGIEEDYGCYLPVEALVTRPVLLCQYYVERICGEGKCCGGGGSGNLRKVNFSPVLDKRAAGVKKEPGDTSLDAPILCKLHTTHLILNKILEPYNKAKMRLLSVSKVQELTREMDGFCGLTAGAKKQADVIGLLELTGEFLRQGILLKLNKRKGLQNRIFFLFRNMLIYGTRVSSNAGFRLHGVILTRNMEFVDNTISSIPNSFSVVVKSDGSSTSPLPGVLECGIGVNEKILILAAFSQHDLTAWVTDLSDAIRRSVSDSNGGENYTNQSIASRLFNSSEELLNNNVKGSSSDQIGSSSTQIGAQHNRSNALSHVCWHRNISIGCFDILEKESHSLSGPLLRKFKNSVGWQRLWITFAHSCLYFYKSANETTPLASLPLLGYKIEFLTEQEKSQVQKENVFKLAFKSHVYFFRAESHYTFTRWVGVLRSAMIGGDTSVQVLAGDESRDVNV